MKDQKMLSFRVNSELHISFKDFCTRNNTTIKDALTKMMNLILDAEKQEEIKRIPDMTIEEYYFGVDE